MTNGSKVAVRSDEDLKRVVEDSLKMNAKFLEIEVMGIYKAGAAPTQAASQPKLATASQAAPAPAPQPAYTPAPAPAPAASPARQAGPSLPNLPFSIAFPFPFPSSSISLPHFLHYPLFSPIY